MRQDKERDKARDKTRQETRHETRQETRQETRLGKARQDAMTKNRGKRQIQKTRQDKA